MDYTDPHEFLAQCRGNWLTHVLQHLAPLLEAGMYERVLLAAYTGSSANNCHIPERDIRLLFSLGDRTRLRAAGDPLPGPGPFRLYRGIAGQGRASRPRGMSWTSDKNRAEWFARRFCWLPTPTILEAMIPEASVLAYTDARSEVEFIVDLPPSLPLTRYRLGEVLEKFQK